MKKFLHLACLLAVSAGSAYAQSAVDGTWRVDRSSYSQPTRPATWVVDGGQFACTSSCPLPFRVPSDGKDHPVAGSDAYDTLQVHFPRPRTVAVTGKKAGKVVRRETITLAADNVSLSRSITTTGGDGKVAIEKARYQRVATPSSSDHWLSGSWRRVAYTGGTPGTVTFKTQDGTLTMFSAEGGVSYTARLDGTPAPLKGDAAESMVKVTMKDPVTLVEDVVTRGGKLVMQTVMKVHEGGRKATVTWTHEDAKAWQSQHRRDGVGATGVTGSYTMTRK